MNNLILQSAINTAPPIEVVVQSQRFYSGKQTGYIKVGNREVTFKDAFAHQVKDLKTIIEESYAVGFGDASTYFLDKIEKDKDKLNENIERLEISEICAD